MYRQLHQANFMRQVLDDHRAAMRPCDPEGKIGLVVDEWGCWHKDGSGPSKGYNLFEQQSSMRDAVAAALTLNIFNRAVRFGGDGERRAAGEQPALSLYLAAGDQFVQTPNYYVFDMYKGHMDARQLQVANDSEALTLEGFAPMRSVSASASEAADGSLTITLANLSYDKDASVELAGVDRLAGRRGEDHRAERRKGRRPITTSAIRTASGPAVSHRALNEGDAVFVPAASVVSIHIAR